MGSWFTDGIGGWIDQTISILGTRYGAPPPGTVVTGPNGQVIRQNPGYPTTPGGAYYPPAGGGTVPVAVGMDYVPLLIGGGVLLLLVAAVSKKK